MFVINLERIIPFLTYLRQSLAIVGYEQVPYTSFMTSRYALYDTGLLRDRFAPESGTPRGVKPRYNISPAARVPVIVSRDGKPAIEQMIWGFVPAGAKDTNSIFRYKTFAAKSEKILETHTYRTAVRSQRCLIPANGFYEWKNSTSGKKPFYIQLDHSELFAMAGIYSEWTDVAGETHRICAVVTIDSETDNDLVPSRLPVIVDEADEALWLDPDVSDLSTLFQIMRPIDASRLRIHPVGDAINSTKVDTPTLIERAK